MAGATAKDYLVLAIGKVPARRRGGAVIEHTTGGTMSLAELAAQHHTQPSTILRLTAENSPGEAFPADVGAYINGVFGGKIAHDGHMPKGLRLYLPS
jgi:hypothetical protein